MDTVNFIIEHVWKAILALNIWTILKYFALDKKVDGIDKYYNEKHLIHEKEIALNNQNDESVGRAISKLESTVDKLSDKVEKLGLTIAAAFGKKENS
jgi:hypothetical protein